MTHIDNSLIPYATTPIQEIFDKTLDKAGVRLLVKREDLNHPHSYGNKWWKLKYNLEEVSRQKKKTILTFGGAYSNHIYATAAISDELGLESIGIIRGEEILPLNTTLQFAKNRGMKLHYVTREEYRKKDEKHFIQALHNRFEDFYLLPEGGSNQFAIKGCEEFICSQLNIAFDYLFLPVGTGGTMAGIIAGLQDSKKVIGISVLKNGDFLKNDVENMLKEYSDDSFINWTIETVYHSGGYGKTSKALSEFIQKFEQQHTVPLEPVYSGKMMYGIMDLIKNGIFPKGSVLLAIHTGGLQGKL